MRHHVGPAGPIITPSNTAPTRSAAAIGYHRDPDRVVLVATGSAITARSIVVIRRAQPAGCNAAAFSTAARTWRT